MPHKEYPDPEIGPVKLEKSSVCRRISIRVHPSDGVRIVIPRLLSYDDGLAFFMLKRDWVISVIARRCGNGTVMSVHQDTETLEEIKDTGRVFLSPSLPVFRKTLTYPAGFPEEGSRELDILLRKILVEVLRSEAKLILPKRLAFFASRFGFTYGKVAVKHNSSNWGSCSGRGNINLNLNLVRLPEPLCDYVLLHELSHLRYPDHGKDFHSLLEKLCVDNMARLSGSGDPCMKPLMAGISRSRAVLPVSRTLEREMKGYRLI